VVIWNNYDNLNINVWNFVLQSLAYFLHIKQQLCRLIVSLFSHMTLCYHGTSYGPVSVCHKSVFYRNGRTFDWFLAWRLLLTSPTLCCKEIQVSNKNKGTFLLNFFLTLKICRGISIVETCYKLSSRNVDAQSVINWTIVDQLSWQHLHTRMLNCCNLSQWFSGSVYSMISLHMFITHSWYL